MKGKASSGGSPRELRDQGLSKYHLPQKESTNSKTRTVISRHGFWLQSNIDLPLIRI